MREETIETDVLCVGGGIAGLMAAIRASELGARVVVAEKGNTVRSGGGATGNDHFLCYIPEIHGSDIDPIIEEARGAVAGGAKRPESFMRAWLEKSFDMVRLWDNWGIPMTYRGQYEFAGHGFPGRPLIWLKYAGQKQKPILTKQTHKTGATIMNRVMIFDLFSAGDTLGALGIDTREDKYYEFYAKSVILATGGCVRLYQGPTPAWMFNLSDPPHTTGDGRAMAYRAGAALIDMEIPIRWAGPKYFARCGKATWVGVLRDQRDLPVGPFVTKPEKKYGDIAADIYTNMFEDYALSGRGPIYMDCRGISQEDYEYMMHWLEQEGNTALLNHMKSEGIDVRKNPVEFSTYEVRPIGGVYYNEKGETTLKGLYAAGDEIVGNISLAATFGWIAGENAAAYSKTLEGLAGERKLDTAMQEKMELVEKIRGRNEGPDWKEVNIVLQQIMDDYAGPVRSETLSKAGLTYLQRLKEKAVETMNASNQHELMHCAEVLNLIELGELILFAAMERRESRGEHKRPDYPFTNPLLDGKTMFIEKGDHQPIVQWKTLG